MQATKAEAAPSQGVLATRPQSSIACVGALAAHRGMQLGPKLAHQLVAVGAWDRLL